METVSVIIAAYNSARWLPETIESALGQTLPPFEVIVVDDGSTDNTQEVLARFAGKINLIRQENRGVSAARNAALRAARGSLIAFLDADDVWLPEKLERQARHLESHPEVALVHTAVSRFRGNGEHLPAIGTPERFAGNCYAEFFKELPGVILPSATMIRRSCIEEIGYFDESLRRSEDIDFCLRLARAHLFAFLNKPLVLKRVHDANLSSSKLNGAGAADLVVHEKAVAADPGIFDMVGRVKHTMRLATLARNAGYWSHKEGDNEAARRYLIRSLRYSPARLKTWILLGWTFLPNLIREKIKDFLAMSKRGSSVTSDPQLSTKLPAGCDQ